MGRGDGAGGRAPRGLLRTISRERARRLGGACSAKSDRSLVGEFEAFDFGGGGGSVGGRDVADVARGRRASGGLEGAFLEDGDEAAAAADADAAADGDGGGEAEENEEKDEGDGDGSLGAFRVGVARAGSRALRVSLDEEKVDQSPEAVADGDQVLRGGLADFPRVNREGSLLAIARDADILHAGPVKIARGFAAPAFADEIRALRRATVFEGALHVIQGSMLEEHAHFFALVVVNLRESRLEEAAKARSVANHVRLRVVQLDQDGLSHHPVRTSVRRRICLDHHRRRRHRHRLRILIRQWPGKYRAASFRPVHRLTDKADRLRVRRVRVVQRHAPLRADGGDEQDATPPEVCNHLLAFL
mmetsp:Transcript_22627/g.70826  ORF Transcript_22627/g.70826 Transcript_22627/m.70826 type:complete len:360 (-) Transcript_22627:367-1446(-)